MAEEDPEAERMQAQLEQLDEHIGEAKKKAQKTREQADLDDDEAGGELVGEWSDTARTDEDPSGAVDDTSENGS
ncbi:MAG: hypothetical protein KY463_04360 [Actinobacteria bacterium]|nr:hypothetical protein [Actinomycetota bacterium]